MSEDSNILPQLSTRFTETTSEAFGFLESRFAFHRLPTLNEIVPYQSNKVLVNVFHRRAGGELGVEFGLLPPRREEPKSKSWRDLFQRKVREPDPQPPIAMYELKMALPVLMPIASMPSELQQLLEGQPATEPFDPLKAWEAWWAAFSATKVEEVEPRVRRLAAITAQFATALLVGDQDAYRRVQEHRAELTDAYSKKMHLGFLPESLAETLKDKPLSEIIRVRREREGW